jgi:hypothetical protein
VERNTGEWATHPKIIVSNVPNARKPSQLDRIESKLDTILSGATFMQELDKNARQLQDMKEIGEKWDAEEQGLEAGDYTDASKEVTDALTAMGLPKYSEASLTRYRHIVWMGANLQGDEVLPSHGESRTYLTPAEFLSRASVTAKELGLVPVVEEWEPTVGDYVVHTMDPANTVGIIYDGIGSSSGHKACVKTAHGAAIWKHSEIRPATEQEIAAHLAEQEAKKPVEFGTRVNHTTRGQGVWMGMDGILHELAFLKHGKDRQHQWSTILCPRLSFTVID